MALSTNREVSGAPKIIEFDFHHYETVLKWSKKAEYQFASKKDTLDEEIELLRAQLGSLENEKKAADYENALLKVFLIIEFKDTIWLSKVGCVFPMVVVSMMPRADFGPSDHRDDALHFTKYIFRLIWLHWMMNWTIVLSKSKLKHPRWTD